MRKLLLVLLLITSPVFALQPWERTHNALRTLYVTPNADGGKLKEDVTDDYQGHEDNAWVNQSTQGNGIISGGYDIRGKACTSNGDCEPYIKLKFPSGVFTDHTFSVVGWFKTRVAGVTIDSTGLHVFVAGDTTAATTNANVQLAILSTGQARATFRGDTVGSVTLTSTGTLENDGEWHMFALVSESASSHKLYIDDDAVLSSATTLDLYTEMDRTFINPNFSQASYPGNFDGSVDEFQFYSTALTSGNVATLYNNGSGSDSPLAGIVAQYHMNEAEHGTESNRIDFDEINGWSRAGDEVSLEAVNPSPDGYISDRIDLAGLDTAWGVWYNITNSGTVTNPIVYKCESNWPSDCRFSSRIDLTANYTWIWGIWMTGKQGANVSACDPPGAEGTPSDDGPDGITMSAYGNVMINNWFYHPANFPSYDDDDPHTWQGSTEGGAGGFNSQSNGPANSANIWYGNNFYLAGHSVYAQNKADSGYMYFVHNIISSPREATYECTPGQFAVNHKMGGFWSSSTNVSKMWIYQNFFTDQQGEDRGDFFHVSDGEPSQQSVIDHNEFWCGGRLVGTPANGLLATSNTEDCVGTAPTSCATTQGRPQQLTFTNNHAYSCNMQNTALWGEGEARFTQVEPIVITGNTIMVDPAISTQNMSIRTSYYATLVGPPNHSYGLADLQSTMVQDNNVYETNATFELRAGGNSYLGRTFAQWKADTAAEGKALDVSSTLADFPTTGSRVVLYPNFYDPKAGILMIYNWEEAQTVDVDFGAVCPMCARFDLYDTTLRPDDTPVLSNQIWLGTDIPVPMAGEIVRTFRIHILN